jgi:hypothetical protein
MSRRAAAPPPPETSTEIQSDISFMNRQKELRSLYRDFRSTLDTLRQLSPPRGDNADADDTGSSDDATHDIESLLAEIEAMQTETDEIVGLIRKPQFSKYPRVQSIKKQLHHLQTINANLRTRAESLLEVE